VWRPAGVPRIGRCLLGLAGAGVVMQVTGQADDVVWDEPSDGAAGVHADDDPAASRCSMIFCMVVVAPAARFSAGPSAGK